MNRCPQWKTSPDVSLKIDHSFPAGKTGTFRGSMRCFVSLDKRSQLRQLRKIGFRKSLLIIALRIEDPKTWHFLVFLDFSSKFSCKSSARLYNYFCPAYGRLR
jgi:hypothetical protein